MKDISRIFYSNNVKVNDWCINFDFFITNIILWLTFNETLGDWRLFFCLLQQFFLVKAILFYPFNRANYLAIIWFTFVARKAWNFNDLVTFIIRGFIENILWLLSDLIIIFIIHLISWLSWKYVPHTHAFFWHFSLTLKIISTH